MIIFASIDIGSYEIEMKIFELTQKYGMKEIDDVRHRIELGREVYRTGKLEYAQVDEVCQVLTDFKEIMDTYRTDAYRACATSAFREAENSFMILDHIFLRTGLKVEVLSNSEQRFLGYKSVASKEAAFNNIIQKGTAIVDVGGGSIQISLFNKDKLVTTQNIRLGSLRIREKLSSLETETIHLEHYIEELLNNEFISFKKLHLKDQEISNLIMVGDYITELVNYMKDTKGNTTFNTEDYDMVYNEIISRQPDQAAIDFGITVEQAYILLPSAVIFKKIIDEFGVQTIWSPGLSLSDGLAYDYAQKNKYIKVQHNFEYDILASARNIAKRYQCNKAHYANVEDVALTIFDSMRKVHGLDKRARLLLEIACILHSCGKYINMKSVSECSYNIIMATEIIGISQVEREIIANVVKYNTKELWYEEILDTSSLIGKKELLLIGKLTAILRVANSLDRSHKQKFKNIRVALKDRLLTITVDTPEDILLEKGLFPSKAQLFEEVYNIKIAIKRKRYKQ